MSYAVAGSEPEQASSKGRGLIIAGVVLLVASLAFGVLGALLIVLAKDGVANLITQQPHTTPVTVERYFDDGIYFIWQDLTDPQQIPVADVSVTDANGIAVRVYRSAAEETLTLGSVDYGNAAAFKITSPGTYRVNVATEGRHVIIGPSLATAAKKTIPGGVAAALAVMLFSAGVAVLIVGLVARSRGKRPKVAPTLTVPPAQGVWPLGPGYAPVELTQNFPPPVVGPPPVAYPPATQSPATQPPAAQAPVSQPAAVEPTLVLPIGAEPAAAQPAAQPVAPPPPVAPVIPAGWYPDSERPGGRRYWDGTAWTEYRA